MSPAYDQLADDIAQLKQLVMPAHAELALRTSERDAAKNGPLASPPAPPPSTKTTPDRQVVGGALTFGEWLGHMGDIDAARLVFVDETGASTKMTRAHGRALKGERCVAAVPHGHWKTVTFVGGLTLGGMIAPMLLDGPIRWMAWPSSCGSSRCSRPPSKPAWSS